MKGSPSPKPQPPVRHGGSVTTIVGLMPLAIGTPMYRPLTLVIIFGLLSATILSLVVVPALYLLLTSERRREAEVLD